MNTAKILTCIRRFHENLGKQAKRGNVQMHAKENKKEKQKEIKREGEKEWLFGESIHINE